MISGIFHAGSGLGDQLHRYITVRTLAEDKGYEWGMLNPFNFKGNFFVQVDIPNERVPLGQFQLWNEKDVRDAQGNDIRSYDPEINFVEDNTIIDGSFEDDKYWRHKLPEIKEWLKTEPLEVPDDLCIIGFRGGEYATQPDLFINDGPHSYWREAVVSMLKNHPNIKRFQVHTDDVPLAKSMRCFSSFEIIENTPISHSVHENMGFNWRSARNAKYAIIPNSAFFILPRLLRHQDGEAVTIAPRYWARHNKKIWARPACYYKEFRYI